MLILSVSPAVLDITKGHEIVRPRPEEEYSYNPVANRCVLAANEKYDNELVRALFVGDAIFVRTVRQGIINSQIARLVPHTQLYPRENIERYRDCLIQASEKRGLPPGLLSIAT